MIIVAMRKIIARPLGAQRSMSPQALGEPQRRIGREHDERRHPEKVASEASEVATAEEAAAVVKVVGARQVELGPDRENGKRQRGERNIDE